MWCAKSCIENIFITFRAFGLKKCFSADRQVSKVADTGNLSNHFRYRKLKFCVYFGIEIGKVSVSNEGRRKSQCNFDRKFCI
jgi:hypothetical protein